MSDIIRYGSYVPWFRVPKLGLTHNLGGRPGRRVSFVSIVGR